MTFDGKSSIQRLTPLQSEQLTALMAQQSAAGNEHPEDDCPICRFLADARGAA